MMKCVLLLLVLIDITHQQHILPEHRRSHCSALRSADIMEYAMPVIQRIQENYEKLRREHEEILVKLNDISHQQHILPEHRRSHCSALRSADIMEYAMPVIQRIQENYEKLRREHEDLLAKLNGLIPLTCPEGWVLYDQSCYLFSLWRFASWLAARDYCQSKDAYLAEIRSDPENEFVKTQLRKMVMKDVPMIDRSYYLGGTDEGHEGDWIWARTGESIIYNNFIPPEPNSYKSLPENCLTMFAFLNYTWNDDLCDSPQYAICKTRAHF
ncbi:C-type lectin domain family 17, member A-like [Pecten maximus]|uniref:C-type lectin domain family 17, member A-like n=1 Tax=Pecten maximus TaxID=6579 RepID=UPI001458FA1F|nr:C-type lectin domain family 17, member A-like [Pecten maximus]